MTYSADKHTPARPRCCIFKAQDSDHTADMHITQEALDSYALPSKLQVTQVNMQICKAMLAERQRLSNGGQLQYEGSCNKRAVAIRGQLKRKEKKSLRR